MTRRAVRKKLFRRFKVGDLVTWGSGQVSHPVVEVTRMGVVVDASSIGWTSRLLVEFAPGARGRGHRGPPRFPDEAGS